MADRAETGTFGAAADKGKGKAVDHVEDVSMGEDESEDDESNDDMDDHVDEAEEEEEDDEDNMEEIDTENIIYNNGGRRTRGKVIDFAKAAEQAPPVDEDEEEDDDFTPAESMQQ